MTSRLAQQVGKEGIFGGKARQFYLEVCRCVPFVHRAMRLDELVSVREIRAIIKEQFLRYKDVKDPRVIDMLIFKGREELEVYLTLHKQRHHMITEYLDPILKRKLSSTTAPSNNSAFLDSFLQSNYTIPTGK